MKIMGILQKCCFCCDVRQGSLYCGIYCLTTSLLFVGLMIVRFLGYKILHQSGTLPGIAFAIIGIYVVEIISTILLIIGIYKDLRNLISPWLIITILTMLVPTCGFIWIIVNSLWDNGEIHGWDLAISAYQFCNSIILLYCVLCVISQLQDLIKGKGTAECYRRRRERRRIIRAFTEMHLPLDIELDLFHGGSMYPAVPPVPVLTPPPYTDKPPSYRENSEEQTTAEANSGVIRNNESYSNINQSNTSRDHETAVDTTSNNQTPAQTVENSGGMTTLSQNRNENCSAADRNLAPRLQDEQSLRAAFPQEDSQVVSGNVPGSSCISSNHQQDGSQPNRSRNDQPTERGKNSGDRFRYAEQQQTRYHRETRGSPSRAEYHHSYVARCGHQDQQQDDSRGRHRPSTRQHHRKTVNTSTLPENTNINKNKGKSRRHKGNNDVVLRSYERNDQFNDTVGLGRFECANQNREGIYPL